MARNWLAVIGLMALGSTAVLAAECGDIKNLSLESTTITLAESVTSGTLTISGEDASFSGLPPFCRVTGILRPSSDSEIRFEVWMPEQGWNGRFLGVGNGGFAGSIGYRQFSGYLKRGFAVAGTDTGHQAEGTDASWAYGHQEKVKDFGWRAIHLTAQRAKQIVRAYYSRPQQKAYFDSCSDGGREALMEAQRFPDDYDGILAGAPANAWSAMLAAGVGALQTLVDDPKAYIPVLKLPAIQKASLAACDELDGVKDGIIGDPTQCRFDPKVLLCKNGDALDCLTQPQVNTLGSLYSDLRDGHGNAIFPGLSLGDETGWREWIIGEDPESSLSSRFLKNYFRYIVTGDPKWSGLAANLDEALKQSREKSAADLDATNSDLAPFAARGGKLILYHGWDDAAISPGNTIAYYRSVGEKMGDQKVASFVRLYMIPGMEHCAGGPGPSAFGQFGLETAKGPKYGLFDSLENWVEKGTPEEDIVATKYAPGGNGTQKVLMTRPLCAYPAVAKYRGAGDSNDAASFLCAKP